ncbi:MAG: phosphoenolpyruvate--protein phosphotransferase [Phycisphaerae bacterium]|nr:phosphoenolpyruvate--protein phosphotransferase [Phycisphaerae bacterium]
MTSTSTQFKQNTTLAGRGMSPGLASDRAFVYQDILQRDHECYDIDKHQIDEEYARIEKATAVVLGDLEHAAERIESDLDSVLADIFRSHKTLLSDPGLAAELRSEMETELINAEHVVQRVFRRLVRRFRSVGDSKLSTRADDLTDLSRRLLRVLAGLHAHTLENMPVASVLVARRLLPSDTVHLSRKSAVAVAVAFGGPASHAALLTRELGIPAVTQLADRIDEIAQNDELLVDGSHGTVVVAPDHPTRQKFANAAIRARARLAQARRRCCEPATTRAGVTVQVLANITGVEDARLAKENGADGVGLYRVECLYLSQKAPPNEDELAEEIGHAIAPFQNRTVTVRLLDLGADKVPPFLDLPAESDPALGRRGVRLLVEYPDLLDTQLRALLRVAQEQKLRILVPMVTLAAEMERVAESLTDAAEEMNAAVPPLGAMIETPAAALDAAAIAQHSEFLSVGTNDLTQYLMAAGRENALVCDYFQEEHPAVLRLLRLVQADVGWRPLSVCGELAGRESAVPLLLTAGVRTLSVAPTRVPVIKEIIRNIDDTDGDQDKQTSQLTQEAH